MHTAPKVVGICLVLFSVGSSYGQSLGDVARAQREKQAKAAHAPRKVVTNEDVPERVEPESATSISNDEREAAPAGPVSNDTTAGAQWKAKI